MGLMRRRGMLAEASGGGVEEFTAAWLNPPTSNTVKYTFTSTAAVADEWPNEGLTFIVAGSGASGWRSGNYARFATRTTGWTASYQTFISATSTSVYLAKTVDSIPYKWFCITKANVDAAYTAYLESIGTGKLDYVSVAGIVMNQNSKITVQDYWVIKGTDITDDVLRSLPWHNS